MTAAEIDLFNWFEVFTLGATGGEPIPEGDARGQMAVARKYVRPVARTPNYELTEAGWEWFKTRCQRITAACGAGEHVMRPKAIHAAGRYCIWCGVPDGPVPEPGVSELVPRAVEVRVPEV